METGLSVLIKRHFHPWLLVFLAVLAASPYRARAGTSEVVISPAGAVAGAATNITVSLVAQGDENAVGFSFTFNPSEFAFAGFTEGSGAAGTIFFCNTNDAPSGEIGVALSLPSGTHFNAGTYPLVEISLKPSAGSNGTFATGFSDTPVARSVSDSSANELSASFVGSTITVSPGSQGQGSNATGEPLLPTWAVAVLTVIMVALGLRFLPRRPETPAPPLS